MNMKIKSILSMLVITASFSVISCKKEKSPEPVPAPTTPASAASTDINSSYQASFSFSGSAVSYTSTAPTWDMSYGTAHTINTTGGFNKFRYDGTLNFGSTGKSFTVQKGAIVLPSGTSPSDSQFLAFYAAGTFSYDPAADNGIVVSYFDGSTTWSTAIGAATQTGSSFKIIDKKAITGNTDYTVKIYSTFNCTVYDGAGNSKVITNGKYIGDFAKF
jgi:hypothetical protein